MVKAPCYRERGDFCMFWSWIFSFLSLSVQIFVDVFISKWQFTHKKLRRRHFIPWHWNWVAFCTASKTKINVFRQYEIIFIRCRSSNHNLIALKVCSRHTKASPLFFFSVRVKIHTQYAQALHSSISRNCNYFYLCCVFNLPIFAQQILDSMFMLVRSFSIRKRITVFTTGNLQIAYSITRMKTNRKFQTIFLCVFFYYYFCL